MRPVGAVDAFELATTVAHAAAERGVPLRLLGGQAVRLLTPAFPPRARAGQDLDLASISAAKQQVESFLAELGFEGDRRFNALHGHKQLFFAGPGGEPVVDVIMDRLHMCHVLEFGDRIARMPYTLDVADLLLSKLQVVEQNEKDVQDITYLLAAFEVAEGDEPGTIGLARIGQVIADDWGWWRTVTGNLERVVDLLRGELGRLVPAGASFDPVDQALALRRFADEVPKSIRWKIRARVGERVRWYELPEEVEH
jgi:hypothetical protein